MESSQRSSKNTDPSVEWMNWMQTNSRVLLIGLATATGLVLGVYFFVRSAQIREERAENQYEAAQRMMFTGKEGDGKLALQEVARRYGKTSAGTLAGLRLATAELEARKLGTAITVLEDTKSATNLKVFGHAVHSLLAAAYSDSGLYQQAATEYLSAASFANSAAQREDMQLRAADMHALASEKEKAAALLRTLVDKGTQEVRGRAAKRLGEILAEPAKAGAPG